LNGHEQKMMTMSATPREETMLTTTAGFSSVQKTQIKQPKGTVVAEDEVRWENTLPSGPSPICGIFDSIERSGLKAKWIQRQPNVINPR
jgi:hypothetical protein